MVLKTHSDNESLYLNLESFYLDKRAYIMRRLTDNRVPARFQLKMVSNNESFRLKQ